MSRFEVVSQIEDMGMTMVENAFINHYMPKARGEYVKIYLYGLKCCACGGTAMSNAEIAEALKIAEEDVDKAWEYWENEGVIVVSRDKEDFAVEFLAIAPMLLMPGMTIMKKRKKPVSRKFTEMFKEIETNLGRMLSHNEQETILDWIDKYKFSTQTVVLLIEDCLKRDKRMINYWDSMADIYYDSGVHSYEELNAFIEKREATTKRNKEVLNYLGIHDTPSNPQRELLKKWFEDYGFDMETVKKACDETTKTTKPTFAYVDAVLNAWHEGKDTPNTQQLGGKQKNQGKTRLENEHNYDVDMLEKALFGEEK